MNAHSGTPARPAEGARPSDARLVWCVAVGQLIGWGTLFSVFPLFGAPMEGELGWSRAEINAALTVSLLVGGIAAVPFGRMVDRRGGRGLLVCGAFGGAALLAAWAAVDSLLWFWAVWVGMGVVQAAALWTPAMALVVASARDVPRAIAGITFVTGFTATVFVPLGAALIEWLGWRGALLALAALQLVPGALTLALLPPDPPRTAAAPRACLSSLRSAAITSPITAPRSGACWCGSPPCATRTSAVPWRRSSFVPRRW